jgi:uncharacterized protein (TIGR03435 family)
VAKVPNGATKEESNLMLQSLLEERFHLALRREQKELPVYALVTGKNGPKMKEVPEDDPSQASGAPGAAGGSTPGGMSPARPATASAGLALGPGSMSIAAPDNSGRRPRMTAKKRNMQWLADILTLQLDRPVMDMTGLTARYDFSLDFSPQRQGDSSADGDAGISIFTAVQEQLGLKLEARKAPVEILVIDRAEKTPTGN